MTGPAPVHGPEPAPTSDETAAGTAGPAGVTICQVCGEVRRETSMVPDPDGGMRCAEPCKRNVGGRPPIGPPVLVRMPVELRAAVEALSQPGEKLAATVRRLLGEAVGGPQQPEEAPAAGPGPSVQAVARRAGAGGSAIEGPRSVLAETWRGEPVVVGPVYTAKGAEEIRAEIEKHGGWTVVGPVRSITKARLGWELSRWGS